MSPEVYVPLIIICAIYFASEVLSKLVKEKVDSLLFFMILLVVCGSVLGIVSEGDFESSLFSTITYGFGLPFAIISFGASVSIEDFKGQYKTIIIGVVTIAAIIVVGCAAGTPFTGFRTALYSSVEIAGGGQAGLIFLTKAQETGDSSLEALMLLLMNLQICVGYPLSIYALRKGILKHLKAGDMHSICESSISGRQGAKKQKGKLIRLPEFMKNSFYYVFMIFGLIALAAYYIGQTTTITHYVWEIVLGFAAVQIGLLEKNSLNKVGAGGLIFGTMYAVVCAEMCSMVWTDIVKLLPQVLLFFGVGVAGSAVCAALLGRMMKKNFWETFAVALGCMVGFPPSLMVAEAAVNGIDKNEIPDEESRTEIIEYYSPQMVISGVVTISILTGIIAGIIVGYI